MERNYFRITLSIIFPILVVGVAFFNGPPNSSKIFMHGKLSIMHADFESECKKCHVPWKGVKNKLCFNCHYDAEHLVNKDLKEISKGIGRKVKCTDCHVEHRGRSHNLRVVESTLVKMMQK